MITAISPISSRLLPNHHDARQFLDLLDSGSSEFCFRTIHPGKEGARQIYGAFDTVVDELDRLNAAGFGVFVVINYGGQKAKDIARVRAVFADFDGTPLPSVWPLEPHIVIETSPAKFHTYWFVRGMHIESFKPIQKKIAIQLTTDLAVNDLPRVMRLPGYLHTKGTPFRSRIVSVANSVTPYSAEEIDAAFPTETSAPNSIKQKSHRQASMDTGNLRMVAAGEGVHSDVLILSAKIARLIRLDGLSRESAIAAFTSEKERGRWGRDVDIEFQRALDSALRKIDSGEWVMEREPRVPAWLGTQALPRAPSPNTDLANGLRLFHEFGHDVIFVSGVGYRVWKDAGWSVDDALLRRMGQRIGELVSQEAARFADLAVISDGAERESLDKRAIALHKWARQCGMNRVISAGLAESKALVTVDTSQLDADCWILGTPNGSVDLKTGLLQPLTREHLLTKNTCVHFNPDAPCDLWLATLERVLPQKEARDFFQRYAGSLLTGSTQDQKLLIALGSGANGKSTTFGAIAEILGDYAVMAPPGLLLKRNAERHPAELAYLQGRRLVLGSESPQGASFDEERVKLLTGGDRITARGMHKDFSGYSPTHKLVMMTNHLPLIRGTDNGIRRRMLLLKFEVQISEQQQDATLPSRLRNEYEGILAWLVRGCLEYSQIGLSCPQSVRGDTLDYTEDTNPFSRFLEEQCVVKEGFSETAADLYTAYTAWAVSTEETPVSKIAFGELLRDEGLKQSRTKVARRWEGVGLIWGIPG